MAILNGKYKVKNSKNSYDVIHLETSANQVIFNDGKTFQEKLDSGVLKGDKGDKGDTGAKGDKGDKGDKGQDGLTTSVTVGSTKYTHSNGNITLPSYPTLSSLGAAPSSHTHSQYVNQNAFSNVKVGNDTISADNVTDTLTLKAGNNVTITTDTTNDVITISSTDTNTTYAAGTGINLSGTTFNHKNSVTAGTASGTATSTLAFGGTFEIPTVTYDTEGHITSRGTTRLTLPSNPNTDTKVTNTLNTTAKAYITGTTSSSTNTGTQVFDTGVYLDTTEGTLTATTFKGNLSGNSSSTTKLSNSRTINGTSFNGTANITTANWGTARNISIGNTSKSVNGSNDVSWTLDEIGAAASSHSHSEYINQNAFSNIKVGSTTVAADSSTDTLELAAGSNIILTPDSTNDKVTIAVNGLTVTSSEKTTWNNKETTSGSQSKANAALASAKSYTDTKVANLVGSAPEVLDTLEELAAAVQGNEAGVTDLLTKIGTKAEKSYVDTELAKKANSSHTHTGSQVTLTGYSKPSSTSAISTSDSLNAAIGKIEKALDGKQAAGSYASSSHNHDNAYLGKTATAAAATKLASARTINGVSFDGTANITIADSTKVAPTGTIVANRIAVFNDTTGKVIKDSGFTIATSVPANAKFTDTVYSHPSSHAATMITQSETHRFVTDTEKATWNNKSNLALGTTSSTAFRGDYGNTAYKHSQAAHAPSNAQKNSDITKAEIEAKLTGAITSHTHNYAAASHTHNSITNQDTRSVNTKPSEMPLGLSVHLKSNGIDGLNDGGNYHSSLMIKGWNDISGSPWGQLSITQNSNLYFRSSADADNWNAWKKVSLDGHTHNYAGSSSAGGAANTAVKLHTARTINGTSFDGTGNITTSQWGATRNITIGSTKKSVNGSADVSWSLSEIGAAPASHSHASVVMNNCSNKDLNTIKTAGFYYGYTGMTNAPVQAIAVLEVLVYSPDWIVQRFTVVGDGGKKYERHFHSGTTWSAWRTLYDSSNKPTHAEIGAAAASHTHNYAGSSSAGGAATSANKVNTNLIVKLNGGSTEGTNLFTFNGSAAKTVNITPSSIGATRKYAANIGDGSATTIKVTHNLGTEDITVSVREVSTKQIVFADVQIVDTNSINILFNSAPTSAQYRVVVIG